MIRKATLREVRPIQNLLGYYADKGLLLPRPLSELYDHLRDYFVMVDNNKGDSLIAVCALGICWENLAEIRSLAVAEDHQRKGLGFKLVNRCLEDAGSLGLTRVFAFTYVPDFFSRIGFEEVDKSTLPHKVWADCWKCPKYPDCDETAMMKEI